MTLSHCPEIHQLVLHPSLTDLTIISSVTSVNLRTIVFAFDARKLLLGTLLDHCIWGPLDEVMRGLVYKLRTLEYSRTLVLEVRYQSVALGSGLDYQGSCQGSGRMVG